jgi:hypothetical protein
MALRNFSELQDVPKAFLPFLIRSPALIESSFDQRPASVAVNDD